MKEVEALFLRTPYYSEHQLSHKEAKYGWDDGVIGS